VRDSKKLSARQRERLYAQIVEHSHWAVGIVEPAAIDRINIRQATFLAMQLAVRSLDVRPSRIVVDGNVHPAFLSVPQARVEAIVKADATVAQVSAASIVAKVTRDRILQELDARYPGYGFSKHAGYPTELHVQALRTLGPCEAHRKSYAPVQAVLRA
jgi:ribonuclease HII